MWHSFLRSRLLPLLARLSNLLPGWVYWQILWRANHKFLIGAAAVIIDDQGRILLFRHTFRAASYEWGLPSGWMKRGESIEQGLAREVYEESRLQVCITRPLLVEMARSVPRLDLVFLGKPLGGTFQPSSEVTEARFFSVDELPKIIAPQKRIILSACQQAEYPNQPYSGGLNESNEAP